MYTIGWNDEKKCKQAWEVFRLEYLISTERCILWAQCTCSYVKKGYSSTLVWPCAPECPQHICAHTTLLQCSTRGEVNSVHCTCVY